ncbi:MAG: FecR domain-containing protein [Spirochaetales bacterium]|nr:FecR domain-containing protein [Spirochaetales bacterium]
MPRPESRTAILCTVLALAGVVGGFAGGAGEPGAVNPRGVIEYVEGDVLLNRGRAEIGQEVPLGAVIQTAEGSICEVVFAGKNIFRIEPLSTARIEIEEGRGLIDLQKGALAAVFYKLQRLSASGGAFRLQTPTAVAGVRGTAFYIRVETPERTYICTCNGRTRLSDIGESFRREVTSDHHKALRFVRQGTVIKAVQAPLLYHDDPLMDGLAARIGARIPWGPGGRDSGY